MGCTPAVKHPSQNTAGAATPPKPISPKAGAAAAAKPAAPTPTTTNTDVTTPNPTSNPTAASPNPNNPSVATNNHLAAPTPQQPGQPTTAPIPSPENDAAAPPKKFNETFCFKQFNTTCAELTLDEEAAAKGSFRKQAKQLPVGDNVRSVGYSVSTLIGHSGAVKLCVLSPDETKLATASTKENTVLVWDLFLSKVALILDGHEQIVFCCAFSPDNRLLVSGSFDNSLIVWDASTGVVMHRLQGHEGVVCACGFSPDGSLIVSGSGDNAVILWSARTGSPLGCLDGHTKTVTSCCFSPDGGFIVSGSADRTLIIWSTTTGERENQLRGHSDVVLSCSYSRDGSRILSNDKRAVKIWDSDSGFVIFTIPVAPSSLACSPSGPRPESTSASPTGSGAANTFTVASASPSMSSLSQPPSPKQQRHFLFCMFAPDNRNVVTGGTDRTVTLWDAETGQEVLCFPSRYLVTAASTGPYSLIAYGDEAGNLFLVHLDIVVPQPEAEIAQWKAFVNQILAGRSALYEATPSRSPRNAILAAGAKASSGGTGGGGGGAVVGAGCVPRDFRDVSPPSTAPNNNNNTTNILNLTSHPRSVLNPLQQQPPLVSAGV